MTSTRDHSKHDTLILLSMSWDRKRGQAFKTDFYFVLGKPGQETEISGI